MQRTTHAAYADERAMYPEVCSWLQGALKARFPKSAIQVADTSRVTLGRFLEQEGLTEIFPEYQTYEINVDVTGIVRRKMPGLIFVECKLTALKLRDVSQLLGYSKVAKPIYSILISPAGISQALTHLLKIHLRHDVLEYAEGKRLVLGIWDSSRKVVDPATLIPSGATLNSLTV
jgi:hypothetical protein